MHHFVPRQSRRMLSERGAECSELRLGGEDILISLTLLSVMFFFERFCLCFPECVARGSCLLGSGGRAVFTACLWERPRSWSRTLALRCWDFRRRGLCECVCRCLDAPTWHFGHVLRRTARFHCTAVWFVETSPFALQTRTFSQQGSRSKKTRETNCVVCRNDAQKTR